jgi:hypothetical protein
VFTIHGTKKLLDRVKQPLEVPIDDPSTALGNWYATALFWRPQSTALFVNEQTLLPLFIPLAPARDLAARLPGHLGRLFEALDVPLDFSIQETEAMKSASYAKTANRSVVGSMTEFALLAESRIARGGSSNLLELSVQMAGTPCGPLRKSHRFPDQTLAALVECWGDR